MQCNVAMQCNVMLQCIFPMQHNVVLSWWHMQCNVFGLPCIVFIIGWYVWRIKMQNFDTQKMWCLQDSMHFFQLMEIGDLGVVLVNVQNLVGVEPN